MSDDRVVFPASGCRVHGIVNCTICLGEPGHEREREYFRRQRAIWRDDGHGCVTRDDPDD